MDLVKQVERMTTLIYECHAGQKYGTQPYTNHLHNVRKVWEDLGLYQSEDEYLKGVIAFLGHDLAEDSWVTKQHLLDLGFNTDAVGAIHLCTKYGDLSVKDYLRKLSVHELAWKVKVCDTYSNMTESIKDGNPKRVRKYSLQLELLYKFKGWED